MVLMFFLKPMKGNEKLFPSIEKGLNMTKPGCFIVIEGLEGAGKSTALKTIAERLEGVVSVITTREPGGTSLGESVRGLLKESIEPLDSRAELLLLYAARVQLLETIIRPAL